MTRELPEEPLPVIPLATEAARGLRSSRVLFICVLGLFAIGAAVLLVNANSARDFGLIVAVTVAAALLCFILWAGRRQQQAEATSTRAYPSSTLLDYEPRKRRRQPRDLSDAIGAARFMLGIAAGLAVGLWAVSHEQIGAALVMLPSVGLVLLFIRSWRGVGIGLLLSLPLGILIFLCICFGIIPIK